MQHAAENRRPEGRRLKVSASGDDASMLAGELGVGGDRSRRREVKIALERKPEGAASGGELREAHVSEFRLAETEIAEAEGGINVGVELGQEPGGIAVGGEEFHDGLEVEDPGLDGRSRRAEHVRSRRVSGVGRK
jgi:hypothetical protein